MGCFGWRLGSTGTLVFLIFTLVACTASKPSEPGPDASVVRPPPNIPAPKDLNDLVIQAERKLINLGRVTIETFTDGVLKATNEPPARIRVEGETTLDYGRPAISTTVASSKMVIESAALPRGRFEYEAKVIGGKSAVRGPGKDWEEVPSAKDFGIDVIPFVERFRFESSLSKGVMSASYVGAERIDGRDVHQVAIHTDREQLTAETFAFIADLAKSMGVAPEGPLLPNGSAFEFEEISVNLWITAEDPVILQTKQKIIASITIEHVRVRMDVLTLQTYRRA